jgi:cytoskeletal protein RodZ
MPAPPSEPGSPSAPLHAVEAALEQSHDVKAKVDAVAGDLASANEVATDRMAEGATTLPAAQVLQTGLAVELTVQEVADDLHQVTRNLALSGTALLRSSRSRALTLEEPPWITVVTSSK